MAELIDIPDKPVDSFLHAAEFNQLKNTTNAAIKEQNETKETHAQAIGNRVVKVGGKGLSSNDFTTGEKEKLGNVDENATPDQSGEQIKAELEVLTADNRLDASAIKNLSGGGGGGLDYVSTWRSNPVVDVSKASLTEIFEYEVIDPDLIFDSGSSSSSSGSGSSSSNSSSSSSNSSSYAALNNNTFKLELDFSSKLGNAAIAATFAKDGSEEYLVSLIHSGTGDGSTVMQKLMHVSFNASDVQLLSIPLISNIGELRLYFRIDAQLNKMYVVGKIYMNSTLNAFSLNIFILHKQLS